MQSVTTHAVHACVYSMQSVLTVAGGGSCVAAAAGGGGFLSPRSPRASDSLLATGGPQAWGNAQN